jgi:hypothetical protein
MGITNWGSVFRPEFTTGGIDALTRGIISRSFDDFEGYANDTAVQASWTETGGAANPTLVTGTNSIQGQKSMQTVVTSSTGTIYKAIDTTKYGYPFPSNIRYVAFKARVTSGTATIRVRLTDASDADLYREWSFDLSTDGNFDHIIDLNSNNQESFAAPIASGSTTWDATLIDRFEFRALAAGSTFQFEDIRFHYFKDSILDKLDSIVPSTPSILTHTVTNAHGTAEQTISTVTPVSTGKILVQVDLATLVAATEGGTVTVRLKSMIDGSTLRTIDRATFAVASDEIHPSVSGMVTTTSNSVTVTIQCSSAATANRAVPCKTFQNAS